MLNRPQASNRKIINREKEKRLKRGGEESRGQWLGATKEETRLNQFPGHKVLVIKIATLGPQH